MKKNLKLICLCMTFIIILSSLAACAEDNSGTGGTTVVTTAATTGPTTEKVTVIADRKTEYILIYPAGATPEEMSEYREVNALFREKFRVFMDLKSDAEVKAVDGAKEILLGHTNRALSEQSYNKLEEDQVGLYVSGKSISIISKFEGGIYLGVKEFINRYTDKNTTLAVDIDTAVRFQGENGFGYKEVSNVRDIAGNDPFVTQKDDKYYYCWSNGDIFVSEIDSLGNIVRDDGRVVFSLNSIDGVSPWAPELHYIDGEWYIYVSICVGDMANEAHRMYCLKGTSQDPTDPFEMVGQVTDPTNKWAIDGTVFEYGGELYTVWSGWEGDVDGEQNLYIAHMSNPWTIDSERVLISTPEKDYETITKNPTVNEGPAVLIKDETVFVVYSCNGSWTDNYALTAVYCKGSDLMNGAKWEKLDEPLMTKTDKCFGPGHCSFTTAADGTTWVVYHANVESGSGWYGRSVRIQQIEWRDGKPYMGQPLQTVKLPYPKKTLTEIK